MLAMTIFGSYAARLMWPTQASCAPMTPNDSKTLKKDSRVYWQGNPADGGNVMETSWDAVTIAWDNGHVARVLRGDMREIQQTPIKPHTV